jgi:pimeloyl-ACP methyl ester carboxylesterase
MNPASSLSFGAPSLSLLATEPLRAGLEYLRAHWMNRSALPAGDGHPVIVYPGLGADTAAVRPLVQCCLDLGYAAMDWGRGLNGGPGAALDDRLAELAADVQAIANDQQRRVSLIGWSLGGIFAREIARRVPDAVRQVITLGTPVTGGGALHTNVGWLYRVLSGQASMDAALAERLSAPLPVPVTSIYSRSDGVVHWQACARQDDDDEIDSVEVDASHLGLIWHPEVLAVVAERLSRPDRAAPVPGYPCAAWASDAG